MLSLTDVHVRYGPVTALQGISITVAEGEIVGLVGPNGAGKSTTLMAAMGGARVTKGEILFRGRSLVGMDPEAIARLGLALVPERRRLFSRLSVQENLRVGLAGASERERRAYTTRLDWLLTFFPILSDRMNLPASALSGGEQQQLAIARAMISRPALLLLDEPSLGLAPLLINQVFGLISSLRDEGIAILFVEQSVSRAMGACDRAYVLRKGRIVASGPPDDLLGSVDFTEAYLRGGRAPSGEFDPGQVREPGAAFDVERPAGGSEAS